MSTLPEQTSTTPNEQSKRDTVNTRKPDVIRNILKYSVVSVWKSMYYLYKHINTVQKKIIIMEEYNDNTPLTKKDLINMLIGISQPEYDQATQDNAYSLVSDILCVPIDTLKTIVGKAKAKAISAT